MQNYGKAIFFVTFCKAGTEIPFIFGDFSEKNYAKHVEFITNPFFLHP
jgi:hypothetical protein